MQECNVFALLRMKVVGFLRTVFYARVNHVGFGDVNVLLKDNSHLRLRARVGAVPCAFATDARLSTFLFLWRGSTEAVAPGGARTRRPNPRTVQTKLAPGKVASARYLADIYSTDRFSRCDGASAPFI